MARTIGMVVHRSNPQAWEQAHLVIDWLHSQGIEVWLDEASARRLHCVELSMPEAGWGGTEFIVSLGGDGTILSAARMAAPAGVPILGVHLGRFGFIAEAHPVGLLAHLQRALQGHVRLEERLMLHTEILRHGERIYAGIGLNDAVVKSASSSLLHLHLVLAGGSFATYPADGVIIATPTGSTGYSLSAGGPIVEPTVQALVITPICPHTLSARPMVVPCTHSVEVHLEEEEEEALFKMDGQEAVTIRWEDRVMIRRSEYITRLMAPEISSFYRKVRGRYLYGERQNAPEASGP